MKLHVLYKGITQAESFRKKKVLSKILEPIRDKVREDYHRKLRKEGFHDRHPRQLLLQ